MTHTFRTPHGVPVSIVTRPGTSDWNTANSILTADEYQIPSGLEGTALDIGCHLGAWSIGIALDNPAIRVIAVDALPENAQLATHNVAINGLSERVTVLHRAASCQSEPEAVGYGSDETHRFIGDQRTLIDPLNVETFTLDQAVSEYGPIRLLKIDCEGCEFRYLDSASIGKVEEIVGEYHGPASEIRRLLEATHSVTTSGEEGLGAFRAKRRDPGEKPANRRKRVSKRVAA